MSRLRDPSNWHQRLGHPTSSIVSQVLNRCNLIFRKSTLHHFCTACKLSKSHSVYQLIESCCSIPSCSLWCMGPSHILTLIFAILDDFSRFSWLYILKSKDETFQTFLHFKTMVENQFNTKIKTDWGGESRKLSLFFFFFHPMQFTIDFPVLIHLNKMGLLNAKVDM